MTLAALADVLRAEPARRLWLPFLLPSFNDLEAARGAIVPVRGKPGAMWNGYNALKRRHQNDVMLFANHLPPVVDARVVIVCTWVEKTNKRDRDGIASGGRKIIHDAISRGRSGSRGWSGAGVIHCDGAHCVAGQVDLFGVDVCRPGVDVALYEVRP